jgi:hypothetical protein
MKTQQQNKGLKKTMNIRLQILKWLSLLQFPACACDLAGWLSHFTLFRRTYRQQQNTQLIFTNTYKTNY